MRIRIGSIVTKIRMDAEGGWSVPDTADEGTVIELEHDDRDGYEVIESMTVRWEDGRVETTKPEGEDQIGSWEIADATPELYANLYLQDREYGGPEEGGWWFDTYTPVDGDWINDPPPYGHFASTGKAEEAYRRLKAWCEEENKTRRSPSSMASEGHFVARLESWPAEPMPTRRPYYC